MTIQRRQWLHAMAVMAVLPLRSWSSSPSTPLQFAAAWAVGADLFVGVLQAPTTSEAPLQIVQQHAIPTRAHGMTRLADGSLLFTSRRPGDWLLRITPQGQEQWHWIEDDRAFNGHVIASLNQRHLYTTETDLADSQGLIGVRDAQTLEKIAEWRTGGMDSHQLLLDCDGALMVANGGIPTQPETGRRKLQLAHMDSSIARLLPQEDGAIAGQWRLTDARLSLRHLAWGPAVAWAPSQRWLGIALQAGHDDAERKRQAPVLALWDGHHLHAAPLPADVQWQGYGGDISSDGQRFAISCPRADTLTWWQLPTQPDAQGKCVAQDPQQDVYCISNASVIHPLQAAQPSLWSGGSQHVRHWPSGHTTAATGTIVLDNHWVQI